MQYVQIAAESAVPANTQVVLFGQGKSNSVLHMNPNLASHLHKSPCSFGMLCLVLEDLKSPQLREMVDFVGIPSTNSLACT